MQLIKMKADKPKPSAETLQRISEVFGVSIDYLLADESQKLVKDELTDKTLLEYIAEIDQMSEEFVKFFLDAVILRHKQRSM